MKEPLESLVAFSRELGRPELDYAILGEGNTSIMRDTDSFWVKASGRELRTAEPSSFVAVRFAPILELLENADTNADTITRQLAAAVCDGSIARPSVEVTLHALALTLGGARAVGHTHPSALLALLCSTNARQAVAGRLFPDEVVVCGRAAAYVPYSDPGVPLARAVRAALLAHIERWGERPKTVFLQNHGLIALGQTPTEVLQITAMCVKAARIRLGTYALGGPQLMSAHDIDHIAGRSDEHYRQRVLSGARDELRVES